MFDYALQGGIGAADVGDGFAVELGFYTFFAEDEDGFAGGGEGEDAGYVDCGAVGGAEDVVLSIRSSAGGLRGRGVGRTTLAGIPMPVSFFMYSARDFVLLFVTKTTCLPGRMVRASPLLGRRCEPLLRSISNVSTVPSNKWSPDHKTPILLTSSAIVRASGRKNVPITVMTIGVVDYTYHHNRKGRPATLVSGSTCICVMLGHRVEN